MFDKDDKIDGDILEGWEKRVLKKITLYRDNVNHRAANKRLYTLDDGLIQLQEYLKRKERKARNDKIIDYLFHPIKAIVAMFKTFVGWFGRKEKKITERLSNEWSCSTAINENDDGTKTIRYYDTTGKLIRQEVVKKLDEDLEQVLKVHHLKEKAITTIPQAQNEVDKECIEKMKENKEKDNG